MVAVMVESWLRNRGFGTKILLLSTIALAGIGVSAVVGVVAQSRNEDGADQLSTAAVLTRQALEADMAHDAIRGDVLRALLAVGSANPDPAEITEINQDLADH